MDDIRQASSVGGANSAQLRQSLNEHRRLAGQPGSTRQVLTRKARARALGIEGGDNACRNGLKGRPLDPARRPTTGHRMRSRSALAGVRLLETTAVNSPSASMLFRPHGSPFPFEFARCMRDRAVGTWPSFEVRISFSEPFRCLSWVLLLLTPLLPNAFPSTRHRCPHNAALQDVRPSDTGLGMASCHSAREAEWFRHVRLAGPDAPRQEGRYCRSVCFDPAGPRGNRPRNPELRRYMSVGGPSSSCVSRATGTTRRRPIWSTGSPVEPPDSR